MQLTVPQMIMLNHAAFVNAKKSGLIKEDANEDATVTVGGKMKSFDSMTDDERDSYYREW